MNSILEGYYVNNVYLLSPTAVLIRFHHSSKPEVRLVLAATKGLWLTRYELAISSGGIASKLRKEIQRIKIKGITQPRGERIVILDFGEGSEACRVILEFFGGGNIIVTSIDGTIRTFMRPLRVRHRTVKIGEKYRLPPPRGIDVSNLRKEDLIQIMTTDLDISRCLSRHLALSMKYIQEILALADIDVNTKGNQISDEGLTRLYNSLTCVVDMVSKGDVEPTVVYAEGVPIDAIPFKSKSYQGFEYRRFSTFMEALDEVLTHEISTELRQKSLEPATRRIQEISASIGQQTEARERAKKNAGVLREYAKKLQEKAFNKPIPQAESTQGLIELGASSASVMKGKLKLMIQGVIIESNSQESLMRLASTIFSEAKKLERKISAINKAQARLKEELEHLERKLQETTIESETDKPIVKREKEWFERYRWFKTSKGLLAVGGRDSSSNSIVIRRYVEEKDLVFHADLHGSPFFILKNHFLLDESIEEVAQAVVIFSRAWKDGLSAANAYWIYPHQVKQQAPSGMYLPRGSFMIQGSKNYIKNLKLECAVGLTQIDDHLTIISGPSNAIKKNSLAYVVLIPDKGKISDTAGKIKYEFKGLIDYDAFSVKQIPVDDIIRVLPPGAGRIILKRKGEQTYKKSERS